MALEMTDLDEYFCKKYANYDKLCVLPGYQMPKMQDSKIGADGRTYTYTLPAENMSLIRQANKDELLKALKSRMFDSTFSFSFTVLPFFRRVGNVFKKWTSGKVLRDLLERHGLTMETAGEGLAIESEIWQGIYKGKFVPTKNTVFSIALTANLTAEETDELLSVCKYEWDFTLVKDVVISYLLQHRIYNPAMIEQAFAEYNIENMFIKQA